MYKFQHTHFKYITEECLVQLPRNIIFVAPVDSLLYLDFNKPHVHANCVATDIEKM